MPATPLAEPLEQTWMVFPSGGHGSLFLSTVCFLIPFLLVSLFSVGLTKQWHFINFLIFFLHACLPEGMVTAVANSITNCQPRKLMHRRNNMWTEQVEFIYLRPHFVCCDKKVDESKTRDLPLQTWRPCSTLLYMLFTPFPTSPFPSELLFYCPLYSSG